MNAMIFAAGLGTRLQGETADKPKALVVIDNKTLLERAIEKLKEAEVKEIVVNVHHYAHLVIDFIKKKDWGIPVHISDETNKLLETGGGLKKAQHFFNVQEPILIYNVDILSDLDLKLLKQVHIQSECLATLVVRQRETQRYFKFDKDKNLVGWINKKTGDTKISKSGGFDNATEMAFSGIHIIQPELLSLMPNKDRFSIVEVYLELAKTHKIKGFYDRSTLWMDVGKPQQLGEARAYFR